MYIYTYVTSLEIVDKQSQHGCWIVVFEAHVHATAAYPPHVLSPAETLGSPKLEATSGGQGSGMKNGNTMFQVSSNMFGDFRPRIINHQTFETNKL